MSGMARAKSGGAVALASASMVAALLAVASSASAVDATRYDYQSAAALCQPTLPEHGADLRSQPLVGLSNLSDEHIFVTCAYRGDDTAGGRGAWRVTANVAAYGRATSVLVSCTLVNGRAVGPSSNATYTTRTVPVPAATGVTMAWVPEAINGTPPTITRPALMCGLPAGTSLQFVAIHYDENVGN